MKELHSSTDRSLLKNSSPLFLCLVLSAVLITREVSFAGPVLRGAQVTAVNDGDTVTLKLDGKTYRTRLIGIDAPEMGQEPWGRKAKEHLRKIVKASGGKVLVETDVMKYDKYDRLLVYAWTDAQRMINEQMIAEGYAVLFTIQPNSRYADRFKKAQYSARSERNGIWGPDGLKEIPISYKNKHTRDYEGNR